MKKIVLILFCALFFTSCNKKAPERFTQYYFDYFDTVTTITGYENSREEFDEVCLKLETIFEECHRLYNIYNSYSGVNNIRSINTSGEKIVADKKIIDLLEYAKEMHTLTGGKTNIAMGSVLSIWHDYRTVGLNHPEKAALPPMERLVSASEHTDINDIIIDKEDSTVYLADSEMTLDVGAIAKGYAIEIAAKWLSESGNTAYMLNVGGSMRGIGSKPNGEKWHMGIENPNATGEDNAYLVYLATVDEAVVTSGSYQRYYIVDGKSYHHIINPETLMPSEGFSLVTVICGDSALGDALSTALFCMSYEEGSALVESLSGVEAMWLTNSGEKLFTGGFENYTVDINSVGFQ